MSFIEILNNAMKAELALVAPKADSINAFNLTVNDDDKEKTHITLTWDSPKKGKCKATAWFKPVDSIKDDERATDTASVFVAKMIEGEAK